MKNKKIFALLNILLIIFLSACNNQGIVHKLSLIPVKIEGKFSYIDKNGKIIINPQFSEASIFNEGIALVKPDMSNSKYKFINTSGKFITNEQYKYATIFNEGIAWIVKENSYPTAINKEGKILFMLKNAQKVMIFSEGLAAVSIFDKDGNEKWGFINNKGDIQIKPVFENVSSFHEGLCAVQDSTGKWGYIDKNGNFAINPQFSYANDFLEDYAVVRLVKKYGVINKKGEYVINPQYDYLKNDLHKFLFKKEDKYGWCDENGKTIIEPTYEDAFNFWNNKLSPVKISEYYGFINQDNKIQINPQYKLALPFNNGVAFVTDENDKIGIINEKGEKVASLQIDDVSRDYINYIINLKSEYTIIETDYFDINLLLSKITLDDLKLVTFKEIENKYNLNEYDFNKYSNSKKLYEKDYGNLFTVRFYVLGSPFDKEVNYYSNWFGTYTETNYVFRDSNLIEGYKYYIKINEKLLDKLDTNKIKKIKNEIIKKLGNKGNYETKISQNYGGIKIKIKFKNTNKSTPIENKKEAKSEESITSVEI
jgi:hypothetical protein